MMWKRLFAYFDLFLCIDPKMTLHIVLADKNCDNLGEADAAKILWVDIQIDSKNQVVLSSVIHNRKCTRMQVTAASDNNTADNVWWYAYVSVPACNHDEERK